MSVRRKTASLTVDAYGQATEDLNFALDSTRWLGLFGVRVNHDEAKRFHVTVREVDIDPDDDSETDGELLFHVQSPRDGVTYHPRVESHAQSVSENASYPTDSTSEENTLPQVSTRHVRVDIDGATSAAEIEVDVYLQTAGDYRF